LRGSGIRIDGTIEESKTFGFYAGIIFLETEGATKALSVFIV